MDIDSVLLAALDAAEAAFYAAMRRLHSDGPAALLALWAERDDASTMNAAGGYEVGHAAVAARWAWWAAQQRPMPASRVERLAVTITPALACTVALEDHDDRVLRVTHIWLRADDDWRLLHRHADRLD
ncbi:MAG: nuclear transport factor 2 family protein [Chloroflexi bacterium]|nr:nuclear transport factor 2 family protein [Chloroflexota bacterium]